MTTGKPIYAITPLVARLRDDRMIYLLQYKFAYIKIFKGLV
ncbi:hypothetical protein RBEAN4_0089 [Rickettsia bellii str. RML An4]|uniref:Uncharacterized protein n=1 Tax=Rickettsia bellii str. RML An4 TaxID=1359193 RepID=A0A0F3QA77_RICBE|nr:hypothetical protein RBEAN4_0089 [Rickettsia bellii str. RML An4]